MTLEDIMISEISQSLKDNTADSVYLHEVSDTVKFIEPKRGIVISRGWWGGIEGRE